MLNEEVMRRLELLRIAYDFRYSREDTKRIFSAVRELVKEELMGKITGKELKQLRKTLVLTPRRFGEFLGIHVGVIRYWERHSTETIKAKVPGWLEVCL